MIIKHQHISEEYLTKHELASVTAQSPLIFVIEDSKRILNYTIRSLMKIMKCNHKIHEIESCQLEETGKLMHADLPILMFRDKMLGRDQMVEILCDIGFKQEEDFVQFEGRKNFVRKVLHSWVRIFQFERMGKGDWTSLRDMGVYSENDYQNLVFQELSLLHTHFVDQCLERGFKNFNPDLPCLENIIFVDIITSIIQLTPKSHADFYLRANFIQLFELNIKLTQIIRKQIERIEDEPREQLTIVLDKKPQQRPLDLSTFKFNKKSLAIALPIIAYFYLFWMPQ